LKIIYAGTPAFAAAALTALLNDGHDVIHVLTQPDRPAGRGLKPQASAVKELALARQLPLSQPVTLKDPAFIAQLAELHAEVMVVAAYGLMIPESLLQLPSRGCLNIHASLLPRWRGAAPIQRAILAGDRETGVTIMQMDAGLDTGAMLLAQAVPIAGDDTAQTLHDKLAVTGAQLLLRVLQEQPQPVPQDNTCASYAAKISKAEAHIDWTRPAIEIDRLIRAFNPVPGAYTSWNGQVLKIWRAEPVMVAADLSAKAGTVVQADNNGVVVATGTGAIRLLELQRAGGKRLAPRQFLAGTPIDAGTRFEA
jgi:methionyl-tRNA formyltransferase